ncbi:MAG: hypothetical protein NTZ37_04970 [Methanoregula sp.]|nr:hypothetical protein [Methanoregula sp.]
MTPTITATENIDSIRTKLNSEWRQIQDVYDTFTINLNKVLTHSSDQDLVGVTIPNTISQYQKIKNDLLNININDSDLKSERTVLVSICNYKINYLQGTSSAYHAPQVETYDLQKSLTEYTDAKHYFQDERDIINDIPYSSKYWDYVYKDERLAEKNIVLVEENILRISKLLP